MRVHGGHAGARRHPALACLDFQAGARRHGMPWYPCGCTATRNVVKAAVATAKALDTAAGILTEEANRLLVRTQPLPDVLRAQDDPDDTSPALRDFLKLALDETSFALDWYLCFVVRLCHIIRYSECFTLTLYESCSRCL